MSLILRIDIDKPFGNSNVFKKVISKLREDYYFPVIHSFGYLSDCKALIRLMNERKVLGIFYFRNVTIPDEETVELLKAGNQLVGFHAENTRSLETFTEELDRFKKAIRGFGFKLHSFTKHGSGVYKLGRYHYPPFETEKYLEWSKIIGLPFFSANGIPESQKEMNWDTDHFPNTFWARRDYRTDQFNTNEQLVEVAKNQDCMLLIHPANFVTMPYMKDEFIALIDLMEEEGVKWASNPNNLNQN